MDMDYILRAENQSAVDAEFIDKFVKPLQSLTEEDKA